jgi:4-hydroxythreonine-4-phosphate dehydrogenase
MPPIAVSMGDPAGIGPEVIAKAWAARSVPPFVLIGDPDAVRAVWNGPLAEVETIAAGAAAFADALPLLCSMPAGPIEPGQPSASGARAALAALETATRLARSCTASALVTGPVSKARLYEVGFTWPGQTEFVADQCGIEPSGAVMMLAGPGLRVVPMTVHIPLADVSKQLTQQLILAKARTTARGLTQDFGVAAPRLAIAGLNPHAGEGGAIGREEIEVIAPAIAALRAEGIDATGPWAADTLFHERARAGYDAVLCPYHDQALIPLKTLHFDEGVNITLGLPIVRTSPDHGTAFDIAGKGVAEAGATIAAIRLAGEAAARRALG